MISETGANKLCLQKSLNLTNVLYVVEHVKAEHDEHDCYFEEVPLDLSWPDHLVDL